jgi:hypothetical protein
VYVRAKACVIDDVPASVGSDNFNLPQTGPQPRHGPGADGLISAG